MRILSNFLLALITGIIFFGVKAFGDQTTSLWGASGVGYESKNGSGALALMPPEYSRMCAEKQAEVIKRCSESGYDSWIVLRSISFHGSYIPAHLGVEVPVNISYERSDVIYGSYNCSPADYYVDRRGVIMYNPNAFFISGDDTYITHQERSRMGSDYFLSCSFTCQAWNCEEIDRDPNWVCIQGLFVDRDGDRIDDITNRTLEEMIEGYEDLARNICESRGENCLSSWKNERIAYMNDWETQVVIECVQCSCVEDTIRESIIDWQFLERYLAKSKEVERMSDVAKNVSDFAENRYNPAVENGKIPAWISIFFGNERMNWYVEKENDETTILGLITREARIVEVVDGGVSRPSVKVYTSKETLDEILKSSDPGYAFKKAFDHGKIRIEGIGAFNSLKYFIATLMIKIMSFFD